MNIIKRGNLHYLRNSFRKRGRTVTRELYLGKSVPLNIEQLKVRLLRLCLEEDLFIMLDSIRKRFRTEWQHYPPSIKKKILLDLSISFTYNTNAIEGSTVTEDETENLLKRRISPERPIDEVRETLSHSQVFLDIMDRGEGFDEKSMLEWHSKLFSETKPDIAGRLRDYHVRVGEYRAPDWQDVRGLLREYFRWLEKNKKMHAVELAARLHYKFEKIHPFGDGNGRIGRLIIALVLRQHKYPVIVIPYKKRRSYYRALGKTENGFVLYFIQRYISTFRKYWDDR